MAMNGNPGEVAAARAALAFRRVNELEARLARIRAGDRAGTADVVAAIMSLAEAKVHERAARRRAVDEHEAAAESHRKAALLLSQAGHHDRATDHLVAAQLDDLAATKVGADHPEQT